MASSTRVPLLESWPRIQSCDVKWPVFLSAITLLSFLTSRAPNLLCGARVVEPFPIPDVCRIFYPHLFCSDSPRRPLKWSRCREELAQKSFSPLERNVVVRRCCGAPVFPPAALWSGFTRVADSDPRPFLRFLFKTPRRRALQIRRSKLAGLLLKRMPDWPLTSSVQLRQTAPDLWLAVCAGPAPPCPALPEITCV